MKKPITTVKLIKGGNVIKQGHFFNLEFNLFDAEGELVDTSSMTIEYKIALSLGGVIAEGTATVIGKGHIAINVKEDIGRGDMRIEFTATKDGNKLKFPSEDFVRVRITPSLDDLGYTGVNTITVQQFQKIVDKAVDDSEHAVSVADDVKNQFDAVVERATDSDAMSRQAAINVDGVDKGNLKKRIDDDYRAVTSHLAETAKLTGVNISEFGVVGDGVADDTQAFKYAQNAVGDFEIVVPFGMVINLTGSVDILKPTKTEGATIKCSIIGPSSTFISVYDNFNGFTIDGNNVLIDGVTIPNNISNKSVKTNVVNFRGHGINVLGEHNDISGSTVDSCGVYASKHAIYLRSFNKFLAGRVTNSRYKAVAIQKNCSNVVVRGVEIDGAVGAASTGIYLTDGAFDCEIDGNKIRNTEDSSIKTTQNTKNNKIRRNICDGTILSQGGTNNEIHDNDAEVIQLADHGGTIPDRKGKVTGNRVLKDIVFTGIVDDVEIKDNTSDRIMGTSDDLNKQSTLKDSLIKNNTCRRVMIRIRPSLSDGEGGFLKFLNNTIIQTNDVDTSDLVMIQGYNATDVIGKLQFEDNNAVGNGETNVIFKIQGVKELIHNNNTADKGKLGYSTAIVLEKMSFKNNECGGGIVTGYDFPNANSSTYFPATVDDYIIDNNKGSYTNMPSRRFLINLPHNQKLVTAPPTSSYYRRGETLINKDPSIGSYLGWVCVATGSPGTWKGYGLIEN